MADGCRRVMVWLTMDWSCFDGRPQRLQRAYKGGQGATAIEGHSLSVALQKRMDQKGGTNRHKKRNRIAGGCFFFSKKGNTHTNNSRDQERDSSSARTAGAATPKWAMAAQKASTWADVQPM
nr:hypothetical protein [Pandoravirus massiliensis]